METFTQNYIDLMHSQRTNHQSQLSLALHSENMPSRRTPTHELYAKQLLDLGYGHALFEPNPGGDYDKVRVGDVGYIQMGKFMRLFNTFESVSGESNDSGLNNDAPIALLGPQFVKTSQLEPLAPGVYKSKSVKHTGGIVELTG